MLFKASKVQPQPSTVGYALKHTSVSDTVSEIVLDLFRGSARASTTKIAKIAREDVDIVLSRCIVKLEQLGAYPVNGVQFRKRAWRVAVARWLAPSYARQHSFKARRAPCATP